MPTLSSNFGLENQSNRKARLADKITKDVMEVFDYGEESVSVGFEEIKSQDWKEKVYKPDIESKPDALYKKTWIRDVKQSAQPDERQDTQ